MAHWTDLQPYPVRTEDDFVQFLDQVGICLWNPTPGADFPNMAERMELTKPDDIWATWFWKDDLHIAKRLFYGKLLAGKPTFIAPALLPAVVAAQGDVDPYNLRDQGRISAAAVRIYEALLTRRRLAARDLRLEAGLTGADDKAAFEAGLQSLSALFQICKVDITGRTRGTYGYVWGLVEDWAPEALAAAARLRPEAAAKQIAAHLRSYGVGLPSRKWQRWFGWADEVTASTAAE